jgi:hypothetical protein
MHLLANKTGVGVGLHETLQVNCEVSMEVKSATCISPVHWVATSQMCWQLLQNLAIIGQVVRTTKLTPVVHHYSEHRPARSCPYREQRLGLGEIGSVVSQPTISLWNPRLEAVPAAELYFWALQLPIEVDERFAFDEVVVWTWAVGIVVIIDGNIRSKSMDTFLLWEIGMVPCHRLQEVRGGRKRVLSLGGLAMLESINYMSIANVIALEYFVFSSHFNSWSWFGSWFVEARVSSRTSRILGVFCSNFFELLAC